MNSTGYNLCLILECCMGVCAVSDVCVLCAMSDVCVCDVVRCIVFVTHTRKHVLCVLE